VQNFWEHGYEREVAQGRNLAEAAKAERVRHFVYASVGGAERTAGLGITHFDSKAAIERHVVQFGITWTIIRPVTFFENFTAPVSARRIVDDGMVMFPFPETRLFRGLGSTTGGTSSRPYSQRRNGLEAKRSSSRATPAGSTISPPRSAEGWTVPSHSTRSPWIDSGLSRPRWSARDRRRRRRSARHSWRSLPGTSRHRRAAG